MALRDIFRDGLEQARVSFPQHGFSSLLEKKEWATKVVEDWARSQYGQVIMAIRSRSHHSVTGTTAEFFIPGKKLVVLFVVEPRHNLNKEIILTAAEYDDNEAGVLEQIDQTLVKASPKDRLTHQPFAGLGQMVI